MNLHRAYTDYGAVAPTNLCSLNHDSGCVRMRHLNSLSTRRRPYVRRHIN
jgi:hypothetical protein